eukprot:CAMPEP_0202696402 /NCGR_PEP_ID=MMETSP1385-20130828/9690_1 /ASSEMBLY_ACC=CAM_ASM_000861 /TAXON_ID=933848 /ORGANISM="Elphidium margaritaceum" /LENGTH=363 /DNA_ID=CAMNT_0049352561 /DNA_START=53 /DNA_END=1141 /DNA_ORIENTATION=-
MAQPLNSSHSKAEAFALPKDGYISTKTELNELCGSLVKEFSTFKFVERNQGKSKAISDSKMDVDAEEGKSSKAGHEYHRTKSIFDSVDRMESQLAIKGTRLEKRLLEMDKALTSNKAKQHISRECRGKGCSNKAPELYPHNVYLCDACKPQLSHKLQCDIVYDQGTDEDKRKCRELKRDYEQFVASIKIPDAEQCLDKRSLYPKNYFVVAMSWLLRTQQQISKIDTKDFDKQQKLTMHNLKSIVGTLTELLITGRQNLNDFWDHFFKFLLHVVLSLGMEIDHVFKAGAAFNAWIATTSFYIAGIYAVCAVMFEAIALALVYGDSTQRKIAGAAAVGMGVGALIGGPAGSVVGGLIGGGLGGMF